MMVPPCFFFLIFMTSFPLSPNIPQGVCHFLTPPADKRCLKPPAPPIPVGCAEMVRYGGLDLPKPEVVMLVEIPGNSPEREPETIIAPQGIALMLSRFRFRPAGKEMAVRFQNRHPQSETRVSTSKNSEFSCEIKFKNRFTRQESELGCPQNILLRFEVKAHRTANLSPVKQRCCFRQK